MHALLHDGALPILVEHVKHLFDLLPQRFNVRQAPSGGGRGEGRGGHTDHGYDVASVSTAGHGAHEYDKLYCNLLIRLNGRAGMEPRQPENE